jgi:hypothetical protein
MKIRYDFVARCYVDGTGTPVTNPDGTDYNPLLYFVLRLEAYVNGDWRSEVWRYNGANRKAALAAGMRRALRQWPGAGRHSAEIVEADELLAIAGELVS